MRKLFTKTVFCLLMLFSLGCNKKSQEGFSEPEFVGQRVLRAGTDSSGSGPPDCLMIGITDPNPDSRVCSDQSAPALAWSFAKSASYAVIATVDLDTKKYG